MKLVAAPSPLMLISRNPLYGAVIESCSGKQERGEGWYQPSILGVCISKRGGCGREGVEPYLTHPLSRSLGLSFVERNSILDTVLFPSSEAAISWFPSLIGTLFFLLAWCVQGILFMRPNPRPSRAFGHFVLERHALPFCPMCVAWC